MFTYRFDGDIHRAKLYLDSQLAFDCEGLLVELEQQNGSENKSSIHYHVVRHWDSLHG